jgi:hypothetical protein
MKHSLLPLLFLLVTITACQKEEDDPPAPTPSTNGTTVLPEPDAVMEVSIGDGDIFGNPVSVVSSEARFKENGIQVNVGSVTYQGTALTWDGSTHSYYSDLIAMVPINHTWIVEGGNGYPFFSESHTFADISDITSPTEFSIGNDYTFTVNGATGADSIEFDLGGIIHRVAGNVYSSTFTTEELGIFLGESTINGRVSAVKYKRSTRNGKIVEARSKRVVVKGFTLP